MRFEREPVHGPDSCHQHQQDPPSNANIKRLKPVEIRDTFALGYRRRGIVDDISAACGKHDFHMDKSDGKLLRRERAGGEQLVKVRRGNYLWTVGASCKQVFQDSSKEARTVYFEFKPRDVEEMGRGTERAKKMHRLPRQSLCAV